MVPPCGRTAGTVTPRMPGLVLLPLIAFATAAGAFRRSGAPWRESLILGGVAVGAWTVLGTEALSNARWLTLPAVALWWCLGACLAGWFLVRFARPTAAPRRPLALPRDPPLLVILGV